MTAERIDAHVHLWNAARRDDILILRTEPALGDAAGPYALARHLADHAPGGAIVVQSAPQTAHSDWLSAQAAALDKVRGVVGWVDLLTPDATDAVQRFAATPKACGLRAMLNRMDRPADLLEADAALDRLAEAGLTLECLAPPPLLDVVARLAERHPRLSVVVDHCGLPPRDALTSDDWTTGIAALAARPNVTTKFSGLIEPHGSGVTAHDVWPAAERVLALFGPGRLMFATNWPVVELGGGMERWSAIHAAILDRARLSRVERGRLGRSTALAAYAAVAGDAE